MTMLALTQIIQSIYTAIGLERLANSGDFWGILAVLYMIAATLPMLFAKKKSALPHKEEEKEIVADIPIGPSWKERLAKGLSNSHQIWGKIENVFSTSHKMDDDSVEEMEEILYGADIGPTLVQELIDELKKISQGSDSEMSTKDFKQTIFKFLEGKMHSVQERVNKSLFTFNLGGSDRPKVIMIVGVNGAGKTTTIGKLATKLQGQGAKVIVGACDTFRAAAVDQLEVWCKRAGAEMVRAKEGSNPSGVAYAALEKSINEKADYCILDTAGRLHTKQNLMEELNKTKKVLSKLDKQAPDETLLVIDSITGQNAIRQADEFNKALGLTGLIFTKCDSSSKAGSAVSIVEKLQVPISYIGVGESVEDLNIFDLNDYLNALLGMAD